MRKTQERRNSRRRLRYKYMLGSIIFFTSCINNHEEFLYAKVIDITNIDDKIYFLVFSDTQKYFIYKLVGKAKYGYVSNRSVYKMQEHFQNPENWDNKSHIQINEKGEWSVK